MASRLGCRRLGGVLGRGRDRCRFRCGCGDFVVGGCDNRRRIGLGFRNCNRRGGWRLLRFAFHGSCKNRRRLDRRRRQRRGFNRRLRLGCGLDEQERRGRNGVQHFPAVRGDVRDPVAVIAAIAVSSATTTSTSASATALLAVAIFPRGDWLGIARLFARVCVCATAFAVATAPAAAGQGRPLNLGAPPAPVRPAPAGSEFPKVGRNDPCPCGSGKKFKQCHGALT